MKNLKYILILPVILLIVGCSGNVKITGTVSYSDDGSPVETGTVCFISTTKDFMSRGTITNGAFTMSSLKADDGLPPDTYNVFFSGIEGVVKKGATEGDVTYDDETAPTIDLKYLSAETSGIQQKIDKSTKSVEFKLDRNPNFKPAE